jgi:hypothetical protein
MRKVVRKKAQMNLSFGMIFAIIAGAFILVLAIYGAVKFSKLENQAIEGEISKTIGVLTNPLESSFESSQIITINSPVETRIYNTCSPPEVLGNEEPNKNYFGKQKISTSQISYKKWTEPQMNVSFSNKYFFSKYPTEGKKFYMFSKTFEIPFKVADLTYIFSEKEKYCFIGIEDIEDGDLKEKIEHLNNPSLLTNTEECPEESINVCFSSSSDCDMKVYYNEGGGRVIKESSGDELYFEGESLMFAAIFSDKSSYECQLKRLIQRASSLAEIYNKKYDLMINDLNCDSSMKIKMMALRSALEAYDAPERISEIKIIADSLETENKWSECPLW